MQTSLKRNLLIGFSISMVILMASSAASWVSIRNLLQSSDLVEHSNKVVTDLNETLSMMKDAETGQRGFLLTGNEVFLQPYNGTLAKVNNKLDRIRVGDVAMVHLMGTREALKGHVAGIAGGIEDRERTETTSLLANVTPTFTWVRLAQRVPVRVALDEVPAGTTLVAGRTASVTITH